MMIHDLPRFARRYGVAININPFFPINTLNLMRAALAARQLGCLLPFADAAYDAVWIDEKNMGDPEVVAAAINRSGLPATDIMDLAQHPEIKAALIAQTDAAVARGVFGAPTFFMDGEMYFGQDRLDFVEEALRG
jgi:2-hydroxychromene-2-carboxylate isomerase